jgi:hypothetical protein
MGNAGGNQGEIARRQPVRLTIAQEIERAIDDEDALLEGMGRGFARTARRQRRNAEASVHRSNRPIDKRRIGQTIRMAPIDWVRDQIGAGERADFVLWSSDPSLLALVHCVFSVGVIPAGRWCAMR